MKTQGRTQLPCLPGFDHDPIGELDAAGELPVLNEAEADQAGIDAARRGIPLHDLVFVGMARYPGSARRISRMIAAAVTAWFRERAGRRPS
jgi:hypothetical protein